MPPPSPVPAPPPPPASAPSPERSSDARDALAALIRDMRPRDTHGLLEAMCALGRLSKLGR